MKTEFEVKINRVIREYTESMFFGLSLRQFIFSVLACGVAVAVYFLLKPALGLETVSWVCILAAVPFAAMGFFTYNGLTAEKLLQAWFRSSVLMPKHLSYGNTNVYWQLLKEGRPAKSKRKGRAKHMKAETRKKKKGRAKNDQNTE